MTHQVEVISKQKSIALVAHDNKKRDLLEWARYRGSIPIQAAGRENSILFDEPSPADRSGRCGLPLELSQALRR